MWIRFLWIREEFAEPFVDLVQDSKTDYFNTEPDRFSVVTAKHESVRSP